MKKWGAGAALAALISGVSLAAVAPSTVSAATADYPILAGDQATNKIYRLDPVKMAWDDWSWAPTSSRNVTSTEAAEFNGGNDFRLRNTPTGQRLVVVDGAGLAAVVTYPAGNRVWANRASKLDGDSNSLWISTNEHSYKFNKTTRQFTSADAAGDRRAAACTSARSPRCPKQPAGLHGGNRHR